MATDLPTGEPASGQYAEDLALARACEAGDEAAWERFVREYQPILQRAALAIDPSGGARESADALFGELYSRKLFRYFHGRSRLSTWLRAVLAQRHVDRIRELKRTAPLPQELSRGDRGTGTEWRFAAAAAADSSDRDRFVASVRLTLAGAIAALEARDRLRLRCYYIDEMTLAAIGRLLREHEATASRNLERTRQELRSAVEDPCAKPRSSPALRCARHRAAAAGAGASSGRDITIGNCTIAEAPLMTSVRENAGKPVRDA